MTTPKRVKRSTSTFRNAAPASTSLWNRRFNRATTRNQDDDIKIVFQDIAMPKDEFINKSTKDCAEINDRYRKLMKEESELLQDLRKLQLKKQLLVKRSKQLKDEQIIKLNLDLQKEKEVREDLEKKLTNLEKKLNQLEKEIDNRKDRSFSKNSSNESVVRNSKFYLKKDWTKEEDGKLFGKSKEDVAKDKKKNSKEDNKNTIDKTKSLVATGRKSNETVNAIDRMLMDERLNKADQPSTSGCSNRSTNQMTNNQMTNSQISNNQMSTNNQVNNNQMMKAKETIILNRESINYSVGVKSLPKNVAPKRAVQPKTEIKLSKKTVGQSLNDSIFVGPLLPKIINAETNTEPIEVVTSAAQTVSNLPKEQQVIHNNLNSVIRDILDRQTQEIAATNQTNANIANQSNELMPARFDENTPKATSNTSILHPDRSDSSNSAQIMSPNSTNVNYSPSSSDNFSF